MTAPPGNQQPASLPGIPLCDFATPRLCVKAPASSHDQGSIKATTSAIVHNQGKSSQTRNFRRVHHPAPFHGMFRFPSPYPKSEIREPRPGFPQQSNQIKPNQGIPPRNSPFASLRLRAFALKPRHQVTIKPQSRQKPQQSCIIKAHQGKRQKIQTPSCHRPAIPPFATSRPCAFALTPPSNQASSRQIKPHQGIPPWNSPICVNRRPSAVNLPRAG